MKVELKTGQTLTVEAKERVYDEAEDLIIVSAKHLRGIVSLAREAAKIEDAIDDVVKAYWPSLKNYR